LLKRITIHLFKTLFQLAFFLLTSGFILLFVFFLKFSSEIPQIPKSLRLINLSLSTEIYSDEGAIISKLRSRSRVPLEKISSHFILAVIATEDSQFYEHHGINKRGILRAIISNLKAGKIIEGGSSITQQLAKNLFFTFKKTWERKIYELMVALQFESSFTKDEIMEAYCNQIYFGSGAYGIENAAQTFFGKHADELNLSESALLAGLPNYPSKYNPYHEAGLTLGRQKKVLSRMVKKGFITKEEMEASIAFPLVLRKANEISKYNSYFVNYITEDIEKRFGKELLYYGGLKIFTTIDARLQTVGQKVLNDHLEYLDKQLADGEKEKRTIKSPEKERSLQGALVAIVPGTGAIKTMIGGRDITLSQYNRAISNNRQPGSGFKPFVYLTAIQKLDLSPASILKDEPIIFKIPGSKDWEPINFNKQFMGDVALKKALMESINVISAKLIDQVGVDAVIENAKLLGIKSNMGENMSLALGSSPVSPLEMASAFSVIASGGVYAEPFAIKRIEDSHGNIIEEKFPEPLQVFDHQIIYLMIDMMKGVIDGGTGRRVRRMGFNRPAAGKTGTTNHYKDAWFTGFTPSLSTSVWVGYDDAKPMQNKRKVKVTGSMGGIPIWVNFMNEAVIHEPVKDFPIPPNIEFVKIDPKTGFVYNDDNNSIEKMSIAIKTGTPLRQPLRKIENDLN